MELLGLLCGYISALSIWSNCVCGMKAIQLWQAVTDARRNIRKRGTAINCMWSTMSQVSVRIFTERRFISWHKIFGIFLSCSRHCSETHQLLFIPVKHWSVHCTVLQYRSPVWTRIQSFYIAHSTATFGDLIANKSLNNMPSYFMRGMRSWRPRIIQDQIFP